MNTRPVGFVGLGVMGTPMALRLVGAGVPLVVWNRTASRATPLQAAGAHVVDDVAAVFAAADVVLLMLADASAVDAVLQRGTPRFNDLVAGRLVISTGTVAPEHSEQLAADIARAGGSYVEAPVSGSRLPAEHGELVVMAAGSEHDLDRAETILEPLSRRVFRCGAPPAALRMKLAVNLFLITMVTGLAEAAHFAREHALPFEQFVEVLDAGPMASTVSRVKLGKLLHDDMSVQASIRDVLMNATLVADAARAAGVAAPLAQASEQLYDEAERLGLGDSDMVNVVRALENRTRKGRPTGP